MTRGMMLGIERRAETSSANQGACGDYVQANAGRSRVSSWLGFRNATDPRGLHGRLEIPHLAVLVQDAQRDGREFISPTLLRASHPSRRPARSAGTAPIPDRKPKQIRTRDAITLVSGSSETRRKIMGRARSLSRAGRSSHPGRC
jgi:hypothetical protein